MTLCSSRYESADYANSSDSDDESISTEPDLDICTDAQWVNDIIDKIIIKSSSEFHDNIYYCPNDKQKFIKMFSTISLWSNVMNKFHKSASETATSSDVESHFKSLKHGILQKKMHRVDDFLTAHIEFVDAEIKLLAISSNTGRKRSKSLDTNSASPGMAYYTHYFDYFRSYLPIY